MSLRISNRRSVSANAKLLCGHGHDIVAPFSTCQARPGLKYEQSGCIDVFFSVCVRPTSIFTRCRHWQDSFHQCSPQNCKCSCISGSDPGFFDLVVLCAHSTMGFGKARISMFEVKQIVDNAVTFQFRWIERPVDLDSVEKHCHLPKILVNARYQIAHAAYLKVGHVFFPLHKITVFPSITNQVLDRRKRLETNRDLVRSCGGDRTSFFF